MTRDPSDGSVIPLPEPDPESERLKAEEAIKRMRKMLLSKRSDGPEAA